MLAAIVDGTVAIVGVAVDTLRGCKSRVYVYGGLHAVATTAGVGVVSPLLQLLPAWPMQVCSVTHHVVVSVQTQLRMLSCAQHRASVDTHVQCCVFRDCHGCWRVCRERVHGLCSCCSRLLVHEHWQPHCPQCRAVNKRNMQPRLPQLNCGIVLVASVAPLCVHGAKCCRCSQCCHCLLDYFVVGGCRCW